MYVVATGNAFDGVTLTGPFDDNESAIEYAEFYTLTDWHVVELESPGSGWRDSDEEGLGE